MDVSFSLEGAKFLFRLNFNFDVLTGESSSPVPAWFWSFVGDLYWFLCGCGWFELFVGGADVVLGYFLFFLNISEKICYFVILKDDKEKIKRSIVICV